MSLTRKRQKELMKKYPDGTAIGRLIIEDYLNGEREKRGFPINSEVKLEEEEILFLIKTINTNKKRLIYNAHIKFRDAIYALMYMVSCADNLFLCGFFNMLHLIHPIIMGFHAYCITSDLLSDEEYKRDCRFLLYKAEKEFCRTWDTLKKELRKLYIYDCILSAIGDFYGFNFDVIRPDIDSRVDCFLHIQTEIRNFCNAIVAYQEVTVGREDKISIQEEFTELLNKALEDDYRDLQVSQEIQDDFLSRLGEIEITIPTVHGIINVITDTPVNGGEKFVNNKDSDSVSERSSERNKLSPMVGCNGGSGSS